MMHMSCDIQVTIQLAKEKHPRKVLGIDIDQKLIQTAWKNLHRCAVSAIRGGLHALFPPGVTPHPSPLMADHSQFLLLLVGVLWTSPQLPPPSQQVHYYASSTLAINWVYIPMVGPSQESSTAVADQRRQFPHNIQFVHVSPSD